MSRDVVVNISLETPKVSSTEMGILIVSTEGIKPFKTYTSIDDIKEDYTTVVVDQVIETKAYKKAAALLAQTNPYTNSQIGKVSMVGIEEPANANTMVAALNEIRATNDDWYILLTDLTSDEMLVAIAKWAESTEIATATNIHKPKLYFAKSSNTKLAGEITQQRAIIICVDADTLDTEEADAAWIGYNAPVYPQSINWKFKTPSGVSAVSFSDSVKDSLEYSNINFMTTENKRNYMKNGVCADGTFIDQIIGADYLTFAMQDALYEVFLANKKIPYTDGGFTVIASAVLSSLDAAAELGIIAKDQESGAPIYGVNVPRLADASVEQRKARIMPDITWEAQQESAVNGVKTSGVLRITL